MKKSILIIIGVFFSVILHGQTFNKTDKIKGSKIKNDIYNRMIMDENGNKINFTWQETAYLINSNNKYKNIPGLRQIIREDYLNTDPVITAGGCSEDWKYSIMGTNIGIRSLNSVDLDNDGKIEVICSALPMDYGNGAIWYIIRYDSIEKDYKQVWVSDYYSDYISCIKVFDINLDHIYEIFMGFDDGSFHIYNGADKSLIYQNRIPEYDYVNDFEFGDGDNDGLKEIAISSDNKIYFYNPANFTLKSQINYGAYDFKIGNVDNDSYNEIVTTMGKVLLYNGSIVTNKWTFDNNVVYDTGYEVELSDIDNDGRKEVIRAKAWNYIAVYDVEIQSFKYEISTSHDISAMLVKDINNDGIAEIIYGDGQWGKIHCYNATTHTEMWNINNPEHGVTAINIVDVNNDSVFEVLWGAGASSSGSDYLYVADINTHLIEWTSVHLDGPFYAIAISDVDNDNIKEIVAVSYESESGYESGIISVFDAITKKLEWQSNGTFLNGVWTGIYDVKVNDIDNDGRKEIIIAAGQTYTGKIWIIDGISKTIKSSHLFTNPETGTFIILDISDVDDDGFKEIIAANSSRYYIIDPTNFKIKYTSETISGTYTATKITTENIDNDIEKEIIFCRGYIQIYGGISHQQSQLPGANYSNFDLWDINGDGKKDIVAATNDGYIKVYNGITLALLNSLKLSNDRIDGIVATNLNFDGMPEFVFTTKGTLNIYFSTSECIKTKRYAENAGVFNSLNVTNIDNDNYQEIIFGTTSSVIELTKLLTEVTTTPDNINTPSGDGTATVYITGGVPPFNVSWNDPAHQNTLTAKKLLAGTYIVTVTDFNNCIKKDTAIVGTTNNIEETKQTVDFSFYPNPANSTIYLCFNFKTPQNTKLKIYNVLGEIVFTDMLLDITTNVIPINISNLNSGIYYMNVSNSKFNISKQFHLLK